MSRARQKAVEQKLGEMLEYYAQISGGKFPDHVAEDRKTYNGKVLRWLEPLIPGVDNVILVEESIGDVWTLRFERSPEKIQIFMPS